MKLVERGGSCEPCAGGRGNAYGSTAGLPAEATPYSRSCFEILRSLNPMTPGSCSLLRNMCSNELAFEPVTAAWQTLLSKSEPLPRPVGISPQGWLKPAPPGTDGSWWGFGPPIGLRKRARITSQQPTWRRHSCLQRRDSSRRSARLQARESQPSRHECLRHIDSA